MKALETVSPAPIQYEDILGDAKGYFDITLNRIAIQEGMSESQTVKTAIHEVAHAKLHSREREKETDLSECKDRNTKEVEAESVAYTVCQHFGIDTSYYSFGYIAAWSSGKEMTELNSSLDTIRRTASELSIMQQAEQLINDMESEKTIFSDDECNVIVNHAYKLGDMEKTRELAEHIAIYEENSSNLVEQTVINANQIKKVTILDMNGIVQTITMDDIEVDIVLDCFNRNRKYIFFSES